MVKGLDVFVKHFDAYKDQYVMIGGTACNVIFESTGLNFRATKDLDMVLCVENTKTEFIRSFWAFVEAGQYQSEIRSDGTQACYRFDKPENSQFPYKIELFSRVPDLFAPYEKGRFIPIPADGEVESLSAIILDDEYYKLIMSGVIERENISLLKPEYLIPLKVKAWLNLKDEREKGIHVDEDDIRKHKNDVFRLSQLLTPDQKVPMPDAIQSDMRRFFDEVQTEMPDVKSFGIKTRNAQNIIDDLKNIYL